MGASTTTRATKITRKDIHKAESLPTLIAELVSRLNTGNAEVKEQAASALQAIATMDHGEHADILFKGNAVKPLVNLLANGTTNSQSYASSALANIVRNKPEAQKALVDAGGIAPLVGLLKTGSAKVQEEVCATRARRPSPPAPHAGHRPPRLSPPTRIPPRT